MKEEFNTRILVIDDDENIRDSFIRILSPKTESTSALDDASARLFGNVSQPAKSRVPLFEFDLDEASNGQMGLEMVRNAIASEQPYAVIFVDMRMPGWDGLKTVQEIRKVDGKAEIIFVTAYSDHSIDEIVHRAGHNVGFHCKPFEVDEITQLATKGIYDWNRAVNLEQLIHLISDLKTSQVTVTTLLKNILIQLCEMLGSMSAMLLQKTEDGYCKKLAIGEFTSSEHFDDLIQTIPENIEPDNPIRGDVGYFQLREYVVVVKFDRPRNQLRREHNYLVRLFLEQAGQALVNAELHETLLQKEKVSAVGQAVSMISHDLRNPIGNILSCADVLEMELKKEPNKEVLKYIQESAGDALKMTEDILDFVQGAAADLIEVESTGLLEEIKSKSQYLVYRYPKQELDFVAESDFKFRCDKSKVVRVILNLAKNALEAIDKSGQTNGKVRVSVQLEGDGEAVLFEVRDNGPGIPDSIRKIMFVPFKTFGKQKGTGLGLAIAKQFIESHKSDDGSMQSQLACDSQPGSTRFSARIPRN